MKTSWTEFAAKVKSPLRVMVQYLWRSREAKAEKCRKLKEELDRSRQRVAQQEAELQQRDQRIEELTRRGRRGRRVENANWIQEQAIGPCPVDPPLKGHKFGPRLISLAVNLARIVGLRGTERSLKVVFDWLGVEQEVPHWTTIRGWVQRVGLAALNAPVEEADDWIWMMDHSNQIGPEKALVVLGMRASQMPEPGKTIQHEDVRLLALRPGTAWKREDMAAVYSELAERYGTPRAVIADGATELQEGAECLKERRSDTIVLEDFKHRAANFLKAQLGNDERFAEFSTQLGKTRSAIQQTELAHLAPPGAKPKARFMNLGPFLEWATAMLWMLDHPEAKSRRWVGRERLEEKLGWLRSFREDLAKWRECQHVVNAGLKFINEQALFRGASQQLRARLLAEAAPTQAASRELADQLTAFVAKAETSLQKGERLPMSTEILESTFALYKQLERQQSKSGFSGLLAGFGALLRATTEETIKRAFSAVKVKHVKQWVRENLGETLTSKRQATYQEYAQAIKAATKLVSAA